MPSIEILAYEPTPLGTLCLRRRELLSKPGTLVTEVTLDNEFLMSSYLTESERVLSSSGLKRAKARLPQGQCGLHVLVGGLGLGYTANEALNCPAVTHVEVVEFLPQVINWTKNGLIPLAPELNFAMEKAPPRMKLVHDDVYSRLTREELQPQNDPAHIVSSRYDLIAIDVDHSPEDVLGEQSHGFYSEAGLNRAASHLNANGVMGIWSYAEDTPLLDNMKKVFIDVEVEQVTVFNDLINEEQTDWLFFGARK